MPTIVATYRRVSTKEQESGFGLDAQRQSLDDLIAKHSDWLHPDQLAFQDTGSGADETLPGLTAMLDAAQASEFDLLVVPTLDRLARSMTKALVIEQKLSEQGIRTVYATLPDADESAQADLQRNILRSFAQFERSEISRRTAGGKLKKAQQGMVVGVGPAPYGYRYTEETTKAGTRIVGLEFDPATVNIAREILERLPTTSAIAIRDDLNTRGIPSPYNTPDRPTLWSHNTIQSIGRSRTYVGTWHYGKKLAKKTTAYDPVPVQVPAMITEADHAAIVQGSEERRTISTRRPRMIAGNPSHDPYTLRGMLRCQDCGGPLVTAINNGHRYYVCGNRRTRKDRSCTLPDVPAKPVEAEFLSLLSATLFNKDALARFAERRDQHEEQAATQWRERQQKIDRELTRERRRLTNATRLLIDAGTGEAVRELRDQIREIEGTIERLSKAAQEAPPVVAHTDDLEAIQIYATNLGLAMGNPRTMQRLGLLTRLRGTVALGTPEDGVKLGRRHHFHIDWSAAVPLTIPSGKSSLR